MKKLLKVITIFGVISLLSFVGCGTYVSPSQTNATEVISNTEVYNDSFEYQQSLPSEKDVIMISYDDYEVSENAELMLIWTVPPTLEHNGIRLCNCGRFTDLNRKVIDPNTGILGEEDGGHGGASPDFVYDRERELFGQSSYGNPYHGSIGMHPLEKFSQTTELLWALQNSSGLIAVEAVDSSLREIYEGEFWEEWWLVDEAFSGQFAVMYNHQFITDFIFDDGAHWWHSYRFAFDEADFQFVVLDLDFITVSKNGKWGLIDRHGNIALEFIFENLVMIDENTAFAKYNGRYGILDIHQTVASISQ
ncbi:MAG: WG repeat-containing protein [Defluviitaleaceae bacterium]|nr:WG repeat-containing protein [Defluviitaleaceae bacterium]